MTPEHDDEPIRGLPGHLPDGERILWQGTPRWTSFARGCCHLGVLGVYFAGLIVWSAIEAPGTVLLSAGLCGVATLLLVVFSWLVERTTVYTITNRRVVIRYGLALSKTLNLPFVVIRSAGLRVSRDGSGDIPLALLTYGQRVTYPILWPHVRPWRLLRCEPMLRAIPDAANVGRILARGLSEATGQAVGARPLATPAAAAQPVGVPAGAVSV